MKRSNIILGLAISSIIFGPLTGIPAWAMGYIDLKKIKEGKFSTSEKIKTKTGMILGIFGTFYFLFAVLLEFLL